MKGYKVPQHMVEGRKNWIAQYQKDDKYALGMSAVVEDIESLPLEELDDNWHTGTPTEEGWYLCERKKYEYRKYFVYRFKDGKWDYFLPENILKWQKIEPYRG